MAGKIFVNYRRDDSAAHALNIAQYLERKFGSRNVFIDVDRMRAGQKFADILEERLSSCNVMVAVIGPNWLDVRDDNGGRRLDNPLDWVRMEIERALARDITVIPVVVAGAGLPNRSDLPVELQPLVDYQAASITTNGFRTEMAGLVHDIRSIRGGGQWVRIAAAAILALVLGGGAFAYQAGWVAFPGLNNQQSADQRASVEEAKSRAKAEQDRLAKLEADKQAKADRDRAAKLKAEKERELRESKAKRRAGRYFF